MRKYRIAFLGNFSVPYSSESHYKTTFEDLGHSIIPLQEGRANSEEISEAALNSDIFFWVHTHGWHTQGINYVVQELKDKGIPTVGYHLDLWLGIEREKDLETDPYWRIEYFFSVDEQMVDLLNEREDMPKAFYLPPGVVKSECYLGEYREELASDIIFVGSKGYHDEWPYRPQLVNWLKDTYGDQFAHWGGDGKGTIRGAELNDLYASAKIVIGDTLSPGFNYPKYYSDRLFETTGRGGFLIFPFIKGINDMFYTDVGDLSKNKSELATYKFNNFDDLSFKINFFLTHDKRREEMRLAGHKRTKRDHTYNNRLKEMLEVINA